MHCTSRSLLRTAFNTVLRGPSATPPAFLLPFAVPQTTPFSTTATLNGKRNPRKKGHRDGNPARGTSALRRTGLKKQYLSVKLENLPKPVLDRREHTEVEVDPDHGLWGFFTDEKEALQVPTAVVAHGRAWTVPELRRKDWEELHRLWWKCVREINRYRTMETERQRVKAGYGEYEVDVRLDTVKATMKAIKHTLTERWYAWENARWAAMEDPSIDLYADEASGQQVYDKSKEVEDQPGDAFEAAEPTPAIPPPANAPTSTVQPMA